MIVHPMLFSRSMRYANCSAYQVLIWMSFSFASELPSPSCDRPWWPSEIPSHGDAAPPTDFVH